MARELVRGSTASFHFGAASTKSTVRSWSILYNRGRTMLKMEMLAMWHDVQTFLSLDITRRATYAPHALFNSHTIPMQRQA
jgi:hypothetical protein